MWYTPTSRNYSSMVLTFPAVGCVLTSLSPPIWNYAEMMELYTSTETLYTYCNCTYTSSVPGVHGMNQIYDTRITFVQLNLKQKARLWRWTLLKPPPLQSVGRIGNWQQETVRQMDFSDCRLYSDVCTVCRCMKIILCSLLFLFAAVCWSSGKSHEGTAGHPDILVHSAMLHAQGGHRLDWLVWYTNNTV